VSDAPLGDQPPQQPHGQAAPPWTPPPAPGWPGAAQPGAPWPGATQPGAGWPGPAQPGPGWPGAGWPHPGAVPPYPGAAAPYPGATAPQPPRSRAGLIVTIVAGVVVLACLGFGTASFFALRHNGDLLGAPSRPSAAPTDDGAAGQPTADPTSTDDYDQQPDGPYHSGDIKQYVLGRPDAARTWPKVKAEQALDLNAAAANFAHPADGKQALQRYHFKDGYTRRWIDDATGSYITVRVLRFGSAGDGDNFASFYISGNQGADWGQPRDVPGLPTAAAFVQPKVGSNGIQRTLAVGDSGDVVAIVLADEPPPASADTADTLLTDEFELL
jgi:hypothetical protein